MGETGYTASVATRPLPGRRRDRVARRRLLVSLALTVPVVAMAMVSALQVDYWQWISLALATPVVSGAAGRSTAPRGPTCGTGDDDGHADLVGTLAAYGWSLYALLFGTAGEIGCGTPSS